ncbi:MAG: ATP-binding cassette domain-containing protein [Gemmatimonadota bacterium]|nr:ATP-binding cassette domain-containing protein [Gemmatimonadota bacterium]
MSAQIALETVALIKTFGASQALAGVSITVNACEVVGVAGPNGSGKSTLGRIAAGFLTPDAGSSTLCGVRSTEFRRTEGVGYQPEETGREWSSARIRDVLVLCAPVGMDVARTDVVAGLHLRALLDRRVQSVSKGQWRMALAACALIRQSRFVVLDEPDAGLDPLALDRLGDVVRSVAVQGSAVLMLSHHLDAMTRIADRVVFMRAGQIVDEVKRGHVQWGALRERFGVLMAEAE